MGDRPMTAYLEGIDKTKMTKVSSNHKYFLLILCMQIEEFKEKVEIKVAPPKASKPKKAAATTGKKVAKKPAASPSDATAAQPEKSDQPVRKPVKKKPPPSEVITCVCIKPGREIKTILSFTTYLSNIDPLEKPYTTCHI